MGKLMRAGRGHQGNQPGALRMVSSKKERPKFMFLRLLPEIRNNIYRLVLCPDPDDANNGAVVSLTQPALTRVNRQIRGETLTIFYGENHFAIAMPFATSRDSYAPPPVTRSVSPRLAAYLELEEEGEQDRERSLAAHRDPVGWSQFLHTLDVLIKGGPASGGGPFGPVRLVKSLTAIYTHRFPLYYLGYLQHFTIGFSGIDDGAATAAAVVFYPTSNRAPCMVINYSQSHMRLGRPGQPDDRQSLKTDLAWLLFTGLGAEPSEDLYTSGADVQNWEELRSFDNLSAGMAGLLALCPQLRDGVALRVGIGMADGCSGENVHNLAVSKSVIPTAPAEWPSYVADSGFTYRWDRTAL